MSKMFRKPIVVLRSTTIMFLIIMTLIVDMCVGHKILVVFPNPFRSHGNLGDGMVRHLLKAGHQVTYITPFLTSTPPQNLSYVDVSCTRKILEERPYDIEQMVKLKSTLNQHNIFHLLRNITERAFGDVNMKKFIEDSNQHFDLVIVEWMFNELHSGFAALFNCPYIWMYPYEPNFVALDLIEGPTNPAYAANFELHIIPPFTFVERVRNLWFQISYTWRQYYYYDDIEKAIYARVFGPALLKKHGYIVPYDTLRYNSSLMLSYTHYSLGYSLSIPQNMVPIAGYHVDENPPPLPQDLKNILDNAEEGVIYFSMGSNLKSDSFPANVLQDIIKVFSEIRQTVIWKFDGKIKLYSDNIHIVKWAPQQSILSHPNCILFITHGGLLSTVEAVHHGTPIIGIPVFYDQFKNVDRAVKSGFAKKVLLSFNFAKDLKAAIVDVLSDVRYTNKAKELSLIYHDRPISPGDAINHWVRHVIATRGALHLRSPALLVPWYQKLYLDLLALATFVLVCAGWSLKTFVNRCKQDRVKVQKKKFA